MGELAGLRRTWKAPDEPMDEELPTFEGFFEDQKERLLRILSVITGTRAEGLAQEALTRVFERWETVVEMVEIVNLGAGAAPSASVPEVGTGRARCPEQPPPAGVALQAPCGGPPGVPARAPLLGKVA
jgi:hypothetical protein